MNKGVIKISSDLLETALPFPEGTKILGVTKDNSPENPFIEFVVLGPDIPETLEGGSLPHVMLEMTRKNEPVILSSKFVKL